MFLQHRAFPCLVLFFVVPLSVSFVIRFFAFHRMFLIRCLLEVMLATLAKTNLAGPRSSKINSSWFGSALPLMDHALPWFLMLFPMATAALGIISWPEVVLGNWVQWCWCLRVVPITALLVWRLYSRRLLRATSASLAAAAALGCTCWPEIVLWSWFEWSRVSVFSFCWFVVHLVVC